MNTRRDILKALGLAPLAGLFARSVAKAAEPAPLGLLTTPQDTVDALTYAPVKLGTHHGVTANPDHVAFALDNAYEPPQAVSLDGWRAKHGAGNDGLEHDVAFNVRSQRFEHYCSPCGVQLDVDHLAQEYRCCRCGSRISFQSVAEAEADAQAHPAPSRRAVRITGIKS